jgi:hypothetical protein
MDVGKIDQDDIFKKHARRPKYIYFEYGGGARSFGRKEFFVGLENEAVAERNNFLYNHEGGARK